MSPEPTSDLDTPEHAVIVLEYHHPKFGLFMEVVDQIREVLNNDNGCRPRQMHVAVEEPASRVLAVFREEDQMALRKHGEGEVIPETEQQKTAAQQGAQMDEADREALRAENEAADGAGDEE